MNLASARELKLSLPETLLTPAAMATVLTRAALGEAAGALRGREAKPPTIALGVAPRRRGDFALAVRVQHRTLQQSEEVETITRKARGEVDVRYIGAVQKRDNAPWPRQRLRPVRPGISVGHFRITAGTLGAFVRPRDGGGGKKVCLLSNNHVLADENRGKPGDAILQPGGADGGSDPADRVAALGNFIKLRRIGANLVDAATTELVEGIAADPAELTGLGTLRGVGDGFLDEGTRVAKLGRTTGLTRGRVTAFELDNVVVAFGLGALRFDNQVEIEGDGKAPFSLGGDSGSLIVGENDLRAVALLFAGSDQGGANGQGLTFANPLHAVLDALKVELLVS